MANVHRLPALEEDMKAFFGDVFPFLLDRSEGRRSVYLLGFDPVVGKLNPRLPVAG